MSSKKPVPGYIWMLAGLVVGLFVAFLVYLDKQPAEQVSFTEAVKQELQKAREQQAAEAEKAASTAQAASVETEKQGGDSKPRFEFYTILSELEVFVPEPEVEKVVKQASLPTQTPPQTAAVTEGKQYLLQAGSFRSAKDAERLKASLGLLGVQASIQRVSINSDDWHRVRIGPFSNPLLLRETLSTLKQNNIQAMTMELK